MTTPCIPDFILLLFQNEIKKINLIFLENICKEYNIDFNEAKNKFKDINFELTNIEQIKIVKKQKEHPSEIRCIARVYKQKDLEVIQCTRRKGIDCNFCKRHNDMYLEKRLKYGTINDEIPIEISSSILSKKKKYSII